MHHRSGGGLFVVCRNRLYTGDQGGFEHIQLPFDLKDAAGFADGSLLLYSGTAFYRYRAAELTPVAGPAGLPSKAYIKLSQTRPGKIWLQTAKAIYRFEQDRWILENSGRKFGHILEDAAGQRFGSILVIWRKGGCGCGGQETRHNAIRKAESTSSSLLRRVRMVDW